MLTLFTNFLIGNVFLSTAHRAGNLDRFPYPCVKNSYNKRIVITTGVKMMRPEFRISGQFLVGKIANGVSIGMGVPRLPLLHCFIHVKPSKFFI